MCNESQLVGKFKLRNEDEYIGRFNLLRRTVVCNALLTNPSERAEAFSNLVSPTGTQ